MEIVRDKDGNPVRRSRNLAGILAHVGAGMKHYPYNLIKRITVDPIAHGQGKLCMMFDNGDSYETNFASYTVLLDWVQARRSWHGSPISINGVDAGKLTRGTVAAY